MCLICHLGFPGGTIVKNPPAKERAAKDANSTIPGLGRSPGGRHGNPLQYSYLEDLVDRGAWWAAVHTVIYIITYNKMHKF